MADIDFNTTKGLHLTHLNTRSITKRWDTLKHQVATSGIHVFTVSETWLKPATTNNMLNIPGYKFERLDRHMDNRGGGVGMFIKSNIIYSAHELDKYNISNNIIECLWIIIKQPNQRKNIVRSVYRPPKGDKKMFIECLTDTVHSLQDTYIADFFILGDMNLDYSTNNSPTKRLVNTFERLTGLKQQIEHTTRYSANNSILDLIFTNAKSIASCGTLNYNYSDHTAVYVTKEKFIECKTKAEFTGRSYTKYDPVKFQAAVLNDNDWAEFENYQTPDDCWRLMLKVIF